MQLSFATCLVGLLAITNALPNAQTGGSCSDVGISADQANRVSTAFRNAKLSPQVVPNFTPKVQVRVAYGAKQVNLGNKFSTLETTMEPSISFSAERDFDPKSTKYTILFVDPDAPAPTSGGQPAALSPFLHLAVNDASPSCVNPANNGGGRTTAMYKALTPLSVASHRYTQLVYRQPPNFKPPFDLAQLAGAKFDLNGYTKDLTLVGGNYFLEGLQDLGNGGKYGNNA